MREKWKWAVEGAGSDVSEKIKVDKESEQQVLVKGKRKRG